MDAMKTLFSRRSIRKYTSETVTEEVLREILEAAMSAPSAGNQQSWHFVIINDRKILDKIPSFHPHSQMLMEAPVAILVCGDLKLEKHIGYWGPGLLCGHRKSPACNTCKGIGSCMAGHIPTGRKG